MKVYLQKNRSIQLCLILFCLGIFCACPKQKYKVYVPSSDSPLHNKHIGFFFDAGNKTLLSGLDENDMRDFLDALITQLNTRVQTVRFFLKTDTLDLGVEQPVFTKKADPRFVFYRKNFRLSVPPKDLIKSGVDDVDYVMLIDYINFQGELFDCEIGSGTWYIDPMSSNYTYGSEGRRRTCYDDGVTIKFLIWDYKNGVDIKMQNRGFGVVKVKAQKSLDNTAREMARLLKKKLFTPARVETKTALSDSETLKRKGL